MGPPDPRRLFERGRARWPELALPAEIFLAQASRHLDKLADFAEERICAEDLYLVAACLSRVPGAVDLFDAYTWPALERHLRRKGVEAERLPEMRQMLLVRVLVPDSAEQEPRIAEYTGRGPVQVWLRMAAMRLLQNARRDEARVIGLGESYAQRAASGIDVEISFIRGRYEQDFVAALRGALEGLDAQQRLLLQFRYREELTSDQIAVMLKTSRVTAHRRIVAAREALAERLREGLRQRLRLSESGLEHLMSLLSSRLVPTLAAELRQGLAS